jgi:6-phosphogluconolactonase
MARLTIAENGAALAEAAAERLTALIADGVAAHGNACVCLTGGSTPKRLYSELADGSRPWRSRIDWGRLFLFWGDERHVPPGHPDSNYGMAHEALIQHVPIPRAHVHRFHGEIADAPAAAALYEQELRDGFTSAGRTNLTFDVMLLGIGEDAHIASIFPGGPLVSAGPGRDGTDGADGNDLAGRLAVAVWAPHLDAWRLTLTPPAILDARHVVMLAQGTSKAGAIAAAIETAADVSQWPAQLVRAAGDRVEWFIDRQAAADLRAP